MTKAGGHARQGQLWQLGLPDGCLPRGKEQRDHMDPKHLPGKANNVSFSISFYHVSDLKYLGELPDNKLF